MAISSIEYEVEELRVGEFIFNGYATIEFDADGDWHVDSVRLTSMTDAKGDDRDDYVSSDAIKAALAKQRGKYIADRVLDALEDA